MELRVRLATRRRHWGRNPKARTCSCRQSRPAIPEGEAGQKVRRSAAQSKCRPKELEGSDSSLRICSNSAALHAALSTALGGGGGAAPAIAPGVALAGDKALAGKKAVARATPSRHLRRRPPPGFTWGKRRGA
eukprot:scaffold34183_cov101-Isochrysis_galbana.AAC.1